jgi:N-succinyldiaminopimelate aminotransferase
MVRFYPQGQSVPKWILMFNDRLERVGDYPFDRLRALLGSIEPAAGHEPISLALGEPQHPTPDLIRTTVEENAALWGKYPPMKGTPDARAAIADWLTARYGLPHGMVDGERNIIPVSGTREALFMIALAAIPEEIAGKRPVVLMPNPFYQVYAGAAVLAGAEPVFLPAGPETGFLPDLSTVTPDILERTALAYYCSPANPQGAIADLETLKDLVQLAREHDFLLVSDECYGEIYDRGVAPPPGAAEACAALGGDLTNIAIFNSLSKRSSAPGLRAGFVAGDAVLIQKFSRLRDYGGAPPPLPLLAAAEALWRDEAHVGQSRELYRQKFDIAEKHLSGRLGFYRAPGGFYLWLDVGDSEEATKILWRDAAIRVIPGAYLARTDGDGRNPGKNYIRCALVHDLEITDLALERLAQAL